MRTVLILLAVIALGVLMSFAVQTVDDIIKWSQWRSSLPYEERDWWDEEDWWLEKEYKNEHDRRN